MTVSLQQSLEKLVAAECVQCLVCTGKEFEPHLDCPGLIRCAACGFVTLKEQLDPEKVSALYRRDYFHGAEYADYLRDRPAIQRNFSHRARTVLGYCASGTLLEIGCAYGFFLDLVKDRFACLGYDRVEAAVAYASTVLGLQTRCKDILADDSIPEGSIDVVAMWDVIEHLENPERYLERAKNLLKEGGYLFLTTGDIDSWNARWRKGKWRLINIRSHLHFFSRDTISRLLQRQGFEVVKVSYPGYFRSIDQMLYNMLVLGKSSLWLYRLLSIFVPRRVMVYINLFDIMFVVARRLLAAHDKPATRADLTDGMTVPFRSHR